MPLPVWKCLVCEKKFSVGEWTCTDGTSNHVVESREYLLNDPPADTGRPERGGMDSLRDGRTRICNIPPDKTVLVNGEATMRPGGYVEFIRGRFATDNPEIQYCLDKKGGFCTQEQWQAAWLSTSQQLELKEMSLRAREQRLEVETNELLSKVKRQKEQPSA